MKVLITGKSGYIAQSLYKALKDTYEITLVGRADFDLVDRYSTDGYFKDKFFDVVIHTAVVGGSRLAPDDEHTIDTNLQMYYNLVHNKDHFGKFIHFGSGAELPVQTTPYGLSKHVINQSISTKDNFYNIRIFAVFNEEELNTRFIKANLQKYLTGTTMEIHQDKYMDFFYMKDLVKLVDHYITNNNLPKSIDCTYNKSYTLTEIANYINTLGNHQSHIEVKNEGLAQNYVGNFKNLSIDFVGLQEGIREVYNTLKN
jgi:dTDP-4-dehydrorhamnose reductase